MRSLLALLFLVVPLVVALGLAVLRFLFGSKGLLFAKADTLRFYLTEILAVVAWLALGKVCLILISAFGAHTLGKWLVAALGVLGFLVSLKMKFAGLTIVSLLQAFSIFANVSQDYLLDSVKFELALVMSLVCSSFLTYCLARVFKNALLQRWVYLVMLLYGTLTPALVLIIMSLADSTASLLIIALGTA